MGYGMCQFMSVTEVHMGFLNLVLYCVFHLQGLTQVEEMLISAVMPIMCL